MSTTCNIQHTCDFEKLGIILLTVEYWHLAVLICGGISSGCVVIRIGKQPHCQSPCHLAVERNVDMSRNPLRNTTYRSRVIYHITSVLRIHRFIVNEETCNCRFTFRA
ncbi:hypothetical protein BDN71DRAFT_1185106 [Pleurotus eryngii]|uniref:Uncharacterized protein n=1 Tax=Pleurotus eryngii TaxID=5323 RepID=A0A9P6AAG2_PLEER|nr:hypothetical protein BDN71DRAFT_1185106 [Pleurotus eryngii]